MQLHKNVGFWVALAVLIPLALVGFLTLTRGTPVKMVISEGDDGPPAVTDSTFERTIELFAATDIADGNTVEDLLNGDGTYPRLWADLRAAKSTITVQMYFSIPGVVADTLAEILAERAKAGVRVLLLLDAFGSQKLFGEWTENLRRQGVEVAKLRKLHWYTIHNASDRSHVRVVVVDGRVGYTGGFGLADYWLGNGRTKDQWRESNVRFEGPAVLQLQAAFAAAWAEATGELLTGDPFFPDALWKDRPGSVRAGLLFMGPTTGSTPGERFLALTIAGARERLWITNSYFVPDDDFRNLLKRAARRGVDVRILTVSSQTDVKTTWFAGRFRYEELLEAGIRIYEYRPAMMHAKTFVVDGVWSTIGSMNFDNRSMAFNNESNLMVLDSAFGGRMEKTFLEDIALSDEIRLESFRRRALWRKALEGAASLLQRVL